jgi:hypothetical protein
MTAQIPDEFTYNGEKFSLVGLRGNGLPTPEDFGVHPYFRCTACWRGFVMKYQFTDNHLILDGMLVNVKKPPKINGVEPQNAKETGNSIFDYSYQNLNLKTEFTGSVLLAKDFIQQMYIHMGFQRPMAFRTVVEFQVENGDITEIRDLSKKMEKEREKNIYKGAQPRSDSNEDIENWIKKTFSLDY